MLRNLLKHPRVQETPDAAAAMDNSAEELQAWRDRITAAGDDAALLQLAHEAPTVELKAAAIERLTQEESCRRALREFGERDKRLYRAAKSGFQAISGRRKAAERAKALIDAARALLERDSIPVNLAVELDQDWSALNVEWLDPDLRREFAALSEQLGARARARGEGEHAIAGWLAASDEAIARLRASLWGVAQGEAPPGSAQPLAAALLELLERIPEAGEARCLQKADEAKRALALAASVVQRAEFLLALPPAASADEAGDKARIAQWRSIPEVDEAQLQAVLAQRFADWRNTALRSRQLEHEALRAGEQRQRAQEDARRLAAIETEVTAAEAARAEGQVAELAQRMSAIERMLKSGPAGSALERRIEALRRDQARLRDWQRWSGRRGREELVAQAQALERAAAEGKLALKPHAEAIDKLRSRWKELDRLGAGSHQGLWLAFDGALKAAYAPVAAHLEKLKAAREENLAARKRIIDDLVQAAARLIPAGEEARPDWRAVARTLAEARSAWQKLGPVEHTVPRKAQQGASSVVARYAAAAQGLEAPLKEAYRAAAREREQLIAAAKSLAGTHDAIAKVRELQARWQAQARALALPRREENELWAAFKAATDAVFAQRDAARSAKEAELAGQAKAREEIIGRVDALSSADAAPQIKRGLAEAETAWRAAPRVFGPQAARLEARYRAARDAATRRLGELAASASRARFDALTAATALCEELEASETPPAHLEARWNGIENFPAAWKAQLEPRLRGAAPPAEDLPGMLLKLELACGIDSPSEFAAERQRLKLLALKDVMEGRRPATPPPQDIERLLLEAASSGRPDASSQARLRKVIAAVRSQQRK